MNTLLIVENDKKFKSVKLMKDPGLRNVKIAGHKKIKYKMGVIHTTDKLGNPKVSGAVLSGSANRIKNTIVHFAELLIKDQTLDAKDFQVIFVFHQTHRKVIEAMKKAMYRLPKDQKWRTLRYKYNVRFTVPKVWLLSCESGTDQVTKDGRLLKYIAQAHLMRKAAEVGFITPHAPPPNTPKTYDYPTIYTLSTGDAVTGGLWIDPEKVRFLKLAYEVVKVNKWQYDFKPIPNGPPPQPSSGKIFKHKQGKLVETIEIPANQSINVIIYDK